MVLQISACLTSQRSLSKSSLRIGNVRNIFCLADIRHFVADTKHKILNLTFVDNYNILSITRLRPTGLAQLEGRAQR